MSIKKSFGGDRLGSGNKMDVHMHGFERSNHNLSYLWKSSMAFGTLVPFFKKLVLPGDTWDIDVNAEVLTLPTVGPVFGSAKIQIDFFEFPIRLYQAQLHNNKKKIGLHMENIKLPQFTLKAYPTDLAEITDVYNCQINSSNILKYLGIAGIGLVPETETEPLERNFNAVPLLGYIDICANYYANKQEGIMAMIHNQPVPLINTVTSLELTFEGSAELIPQLPGAPVSISTNNGSTIDISYDGATPDATQIYIVTDIGTFAASELVIGNFVDIGGLLTANYDYARYGTINFNNWRYQRQSEAPVIPPTIVTFPLEQCDTIREELLEKATVGAAPVVLNALGSGLMTGPIQYILWEDNENQLNSLMGTQEGLILKTYQSDLLNNWIDGPSGINAMTAVSTAGDQFTIDALILANKIYDVLNRVAASGGSYYDWVEVSYDHRTWYQCETPMWHGGLSKELVFQAVVSNSQSGTQPLGTLAGRGLTGSKHKGGKLTIKVNEPGYIMGIISVTPRLDYSQGNEFDIDLQTMNDLHKPGLDGIAFQDLPTERFAWWDTYQNGGDLIQQSAGKQPAWIEYTTSINRAYGNFAIGQPVGEMFMTFNRRYEFDPGAPGIIDLTTYVDPVKMNHIFAQTSLDAQNLWVQIATNAHARRKMSGRLIPNL